MRLPVLSSWLAWRYLRPKGRVLPLTVSLSLFGLMIGVACLVVAMAIFSGFETALRNSVIDITGDLILVKRRSYEENWEKLIERVKREEPQVQHAVRFFRPEGIMAHQGKLLGVMIQAIDLENVSNVLKIQNKVIEGKYFSSKNKEPEALLGKGLAKKMGLKVGDTFKVVFPLPNEINPNSFLRKLGSFKVRGVVDVGKYEFNERLVVTSLRTVQKLFGDKSLYAGLVLKLKDSMQAREVGHRLRKKMGPKYWLQDWKAVNENLFESLGFEKMILFFVLLITVIAAAFNISGSLFINIVQKFSDMSVLKTLGIKPRTIMGIFCFQGTLIGAVGTIGGLILGWGLCHVVLFLQDQFLHLPADVYKLGRIPPEMRWIDIGIILIVAMFICFLSTLIPARRGARLKPVEGLRYD